MRERVPRGITAQVLVLCLLVLAAATPTLAEGVETTRLSERVFMLVTSQGSYTTNSLAFLSDEGLLLVDTQSAADRDAFAKAIEALGAGEPRFIINTHRHTEHIGGNDLWGSAPLIIAHELCLEHLRSGASLFSEYPREMLPEITFRENLTLELGDERVELTFIGGSHDDNEIMVHFRNEKIVHLSSLVNGFTFPSMDDAGSVKSFAPLVQAALERLPRDVTIVSGHNAVGGYADLERYHEMLVQTAESVAAALRKGESVEQLQQRDLLEEWAEFPVSYVDRNAWIETLARADESDADAKRDVFEPLFAAWKAGGAEKAIALYRETRDTEEGDYDLDELDLLVVGNILRGRELREDAIHFFEAGLEEYPGGRYDFFVHFALAELYEGLGRRAQALEHCRLSLDLNPEYARARALLETLEGDQAAPATP